MLLELRAGARIVPMSKGRESMRLHLDKAQRDNRICIGAIVAIMILTGSAIFVMGAPFYLPAQTMARVVLASPF